MSPEVLSLATGFRKAAAFVVRDYRIESSYKLNFVLHGANSLVPLVFFFFLSRMMNSSGAPGLDRYGCDYFTFVVIGIAFHRYLELSTRMFADSIRLAQVTGCLETMLGSQTRPTTIVFHSSLYGLISTSFHLVLILFVAYLGFGLDVSKADPIAALVVFLLSVATFIGFGIVAATAIVIFKRGDPVTWAVTTLGVVLGGAYFPVDVMPEWLQSVSAIVPLTHSLDALRLTLIKGYSLSMVSTQVAILGAMAAVLLPLSLVSFSIAVMKGRRDGTLMEY